MAAIKVLIIMLLALNNGMAQNSNGLKILVPQNVKATDSTLEKQVYIMWQSLGKDYEYRVVRATTSKTAPKAATPIGDDWQTNNYLIDRSVKDGKPYYYFVKARIKNKVDESLYSAVAKGSSAIFAGSKHEENELSQKNGEAVDSLKAIIRLFEDVYALTKPVSLGYMVENLKKQPTNAVKIHIYLSKNETLGDDDRLLVTETIPSIEGLETKRNALTFPIPPSVSAGNYWFLLTIEPTKHVFATRATVLK